MKKSIFLFFAAILCAMSVGAAVVTPTGKYFYFKTNSDWKVDGARFAVCFQWKNGGGQDDSWYSCVNVEGDVYYVVAPAEYWDMYFCRMNGSTNVNSWANKWNQSTKLQYDGTNNYFQKNAGWNEDVTYNSNYAPPMSSVTLADNGTTVNSGTGTQADPYIIEIGTKIKVQASGTKAVDDPDAVINYAFKYGATSQDSETTTWEIDANSPSTTYAIELEGYTKVNTTSSTKKAATKLYYQTVADATLPTYQVTVTVNDPAMGTVTGAGEYSEGATVEITATPNAGYQFKNWTVAGAEVSTANPYTFTAEEDVTVVANFEEIPTHDITVKAFYPASWNAGKAAIHFWGDGVVSPGTPAAMEKDGDWWSYTVTGVPTTSELSVIFINGDNWSGNANQTVDITGVTESTCFEVLQSGSAKGTATKVDCESAPVIPENTYTVVGSSAPLFGETWAPAKAENDMTLVEGTNYELVKTDVSLTVGEIQYKVAVNHAWDEAYPGVNAILNIAEAGKYTITFTFDSNTKAVNATAELTEAAVVLPTVGVKGAWDGWAATTTLTGDNTSASAIVNIATAGIYEFGLDVDGNFQASGATIDKANNSTVVTSNAGNMKLTANVLGEYTFTWTYETNTLTVTYPAGEEVEIAKKYYIAGTENLTGFDWKENGLEIAKEGDVYKHTFSELGAGIYEFKITDGTWTNPWGYSNLGAAYEEVSEGTDGEGNPNGNIKIITEEAKNITVIFDATAGKITLEGLTEKVVVISYVLMGVGSDWTTGIALTKNETAEYGEEYVLLDQEILEGDAVKVVTLINGVPTYYCGAVEIASPVKFEFDENGNIVLLPGKYDFYFKVNDPTTYEDDAMYITGEAYPEVPTAIDNVDTAVAPAKVINNGQLIIIRNGVQYNAQGAVVK